MLRQVRALDNASLASAAGACYDIEMRPETLSLLPFAGFCHDGAGVCRGGARALPLAVAGNARGKVLP